MGFVSKTIDDLKSTESRHSITKMVLGAAAGILAKKLAENLYESVSGHGKTS